MYMHHVICLTDLCRSAVPGGPHVLSVRGIGAHKEIRETPRRGERWQTLMISMTYDAHCVPCKRWRVGLVVWNVARAGSHIVQNYQK